LNKNLPIKNEQS